MNINQINNCIQKINETVGANVENSNEPNANSPENLNEADSESDDESNDSDVPTDRISSTVISKINCYNHEKQLYEVTTTAGEECYLNANDNTLINQSQTQVVDASFKNSNMFVDKNKVPYYLYFNNAQPTRVIEIVSDTIGRLDNYGLCYVDLDNHTVADASGYTQYSIELPDDVVAYYKQKVNAEANNLRETIIEIVVLIILVAIVIAIGYMFYKEHKNAEQEVIDTAAATADYRIRL